LNTKSVAEMLGISTRTVQRWVKQLNLNMERNELGHFIFTDENIEQIKQVKKQLDEGILLQDITVEKSTRSGIVRNSQPEKIKEEIQEELEDKISLLETSLYQKADSVVSYQLLQHRREIEELQEQVSFLTRRLADLEELFFMVNETAASLDQKQFEGPLTPRKKKGFMRRIFGF
jgi:chromosome-anchoring protein RacA